RMKDFAGKIAFITGGAGGIGFAMARAFGRRGMKISIADVEAETCAEAVDALRREGITTIGSACDVSDRDSLAEASAKTFAVVGMSEVLAAELQETPIGVSVLCPSWVRTRMLDNGRNRPDRFGGPIKLDADNANAERNARYARALEGGLDPADVAELAIGAI